MLRPSWIFLIALLLSACGSTGPRPIQLGSACTPGDQVFVCASGLCVALDNQSGFCTDNCVTDDACPPNFICQAAGRYGRICRPLDGCKLESDCPSGHTCNPDTGHCFIAVSRALCSPCQDVNQCPTGGACFSALGSGEQFCTAPCEAGDSCPAGYDCRDIPAGPENALIKQCVPTNESCNNGKSICQPCQGDSECGGPFDLCVRNVVSGETFCGRDCNPAKNVCPQAGCDPKLLDSAANPDCPTGFSCTNIGKSDDPNVVGPYQCVPNSNTCAGYCDSTAAQGQVSDCGIGKLCSNNVCTGASDGRMCSPCVDNDDCRRGGFAENRCIVNNCPNCPFNGESFCSTPCADDAACVRTFGVGFTCKPVDDPSGPQRSYCMPQRGTCKSGLGRLGEDCSVGGAQDCLTGICLEAGLNDFCSSPCTDDLGCSDPRFRCCETSGTGGYDCSPAHRVPGGPLSGTGVCAPYGGLFGDDCSPGRAPCQSGTCLDLGTARVCSVSCASGTCPDGFACRQAFAADGVMQVPVCFPNGGGKAGGNCEFGPAACESGLCIRKDSGPICTQGCMTDADCPTDWICDTLLSVTNQSVQACLPPALQDG
ncbi:MAG: hypothetical protein QM817_15030 [Archangium sp.]